MGVGIAGAGQDVTDAELWWGGLCDRRRPHRIAKGAVDEQSCTRRISADAEQQGGQRILEVERRRIAAVGGQNTVADDHWIVSAARQQLREPDADPVRGVVLKCKG